MFKWEFDVKDVAGLVSALASQDAIPVPSQMLLANGGDSRLDRLESVRTGTAQCSEAQWGLRRWTRGRRSRFEVGQGPAVATGCWHVLRKVGQWAQSLYSNSWSFGAASSFAAEWINATKGNMTSPLSKIRSGAFALTLIVIGAIVAFRIAGGYTWLEAIWLVVITISTVGFSENPQSTEWVQLITIALIVLGVSAAAYTCGGFIQLALEGEVERVLGNRKMNSEIAKLKNHVIICGFGRLGSDLAGQLRHRRAPFVVIDKDPEKFGSHEGQDLLRVIGDATDEVVLGEARLHEAKAVVLALPSDAENVFIALTARNLSPDIQIVSKAEQENSCAKLRQAGANKIVMPHKVGAQQMERMISRPTTADLVELFAEASHLDMELDELLVGGASRFVGSSLADSGIKEQYNLLVVGIKNRAGELHFNPPPTASIQAGDTVLVMGDVKDINRMKTNCE